jgi:hypothetical protein
MGWAVCGIVYGKILLETVVQSLISLTLRLGKLSLNRRLFSELLKNKQPLYGGFKTTEKLWYCCAH